MKKLWQKWCSIPIPTRFAIGIWISLLGGVLGRVAIDSPLSQSVLPIYLLGADRWQNGQPLYDPPPETLDVYRNPPFVAVSTVPFGWLPPRLAALLWRSLFIVLYLLGLKQFLKDIVPPLTTGRQNVFYILSAILVIHGFNNAQLNLFVVASALLGVSAAGRGAWWQSSFWLVLGAMVKVYPIALLGLVAISFPRQLIPRSILFGGIALGLPFLTQDPLYVAQQYRGFVQASGEDDRSEADIKRSPRDWSVVPRAMADLIIPRNVVLLVNTAMGLVLAIIMVIAVHYWQLQTSDLLRLAFCTGLIWMTLFGPSTEMNTYSILAPVAACSVVLRRSQILGWIGALLLSGAVIRAGFPSHGPTGMGRLQPIGAMILLIATIVTRRQERVTPIEVEDGQPSQTR